LALVAELVRYRNLMSDNIRWEGFEFRDDDIVISTSPKCGTTWTQMLCALLVFQTADLARPLTAISPWLDQQTANHDDVLAELASQRHRRFIKTHTPLDGLPYDERVTYLCVGRDPRDVAVSMDNHWANMDFDQVFKVRADAVGSDDLQDVMSSASLAQRSDDPVERFRVWVDNDRSPPLVGSSLWAVLNHVDTFWVVRDRPNVTLFHYFDLEADLEGEMARLADVLHIDIAPERIRELAPAARWDAMRSRAAVVAPNSDIGIFRDLENFFHRGESGQWRALLDADDLAHYEARVRQLASPELARWVHHGHRAA
jgi:aryl sulfotransferase